MEVVASLTLLPTMPCPLGLPKGGCAKVQPVRMNQKGKIQSISVNL